MCALVGCEDTAPAVGGGGGTDGGDADGGADAATAAGDARPGAPDNDPDAGTQAPDAATPAPDAEVCAPADERCNGMDDDCDGAADEDWPLGETCDGDDADLCALGQWRCAEDGTAAVCADDEPVTEVCNGLDDDCDGTTDEDAIDPPLADRQDGLCADARQVCGPDGEWVEPDYTLIEGYEPAEATCDGLDNDCDGRIDAGLFAPPGEHTDGVCAAVQQTCGGADGWLEPEYEALRDFEADEASCDGLDNDCDGVTDEAPPPPCLLILGVCTVPAAPPPCEGAAGFGACTFGPDFEVDERDRCDGLDNDCDGGIDEGGGCAVDAQSVRVPAGSFLMGSPADEPAREADEAQFEVTLTRDLLVRRTEITQAEWVALMGGDNPSAQPGADRPVEQIAWFEAAAFANAVSESEGLPACYLIEGQDVQWPDGPDCTGWRLPTEAEWEYVARAGEDGAVPAEGLDAHAWTRANADGGPQPVAGRAANGFGLYDVLGNVAEWVWDAKADYPMGAAEDPSGPEGGAARVARGGTWAALESRVRFANRADFPPTTRNPDLGVRLVRTPPADASWEAP
jgi:formylglycine-generating enzyme required for sulfatase activity